MWPTRPSRCSASPPNRLPVGASPTLHLMLRIFYDHCSKSGSPRELLPVQGALNEMQSRLAPSECDRGSHGQGPKPILPISPTENPSMCSKESWVCTGAKAVQPDQRFARCCHPWLTQFQLPSSSATKNRRVVGWYLLHVLRCCKK